MGIGRAGIGGLGIGGLGIGGLGIPSPVSDPAFIIEVDTTNTGSASDTIELPFTGEGTVDWDDGAGPVIFDSTGGGGIANTYSVSGIYTIKIISTVSSRMLFNNGGDRLKVLDISNWGSIAWSSMNDAFFGCANLIVSATDIPDFSNLTDCGFMFRACSVLTADVSLWDMSNVTIISNMFRDCLVFTSDLSSWNVSSVTMFTSMFRGAAAFNSNISGWNVSIATSLLDMFRFASSFNQDLSGWQIQNATTMGQMLNDTALSTANLDLIYNAWSLLSVQPNVPFGANDTSYTIATSQAARDILTGGANLWTITDNGGI